MTPADVADIVTFCVVVVVVVDTGNVALVCPAGTVTCAAAVASGLLLPTVTGVPPAGAAEASVTVQEVAAPPVTLAGEHTSEETAG